MIEDEIQELERSLMTTEVRSSAERLDPLLSQDFMEFGSSGRVYTKEQSISIAMTNARIQTSLLDFRATIIASDVVFTTYRAAGSLRSSLWRSETDGCRMFFHQGTPSSPHA